MKNHKIILNTLLITFFFLASATFVYSDGASQGLETSKTPTPNSPEKELSLTVEQEPLKYTMGSDDVIEIDVRHHPEFSGKYAINSEGKIQYKFIGDIPIAGLNKLETKEKLANVLSKYIIDPDIEVTILQYRSKVIFIIGEVGAPGKYYMRADSVSVRDAVVQAGLPTLSASMRKARLIHPSAKGRPKQEKIDIYKIIYEGKLSLDKDMLPGDILYIPATLFAKAARILHPVASPITSAGTIERAATGGL
ncbi:polysaccharide biosynthesis/export family protein [Candidatus Omnitrophota bacterium]